MAKQQAHVSHDLRRSKRIASTQSSASSVSSYPPNELKKKSKRIVNARSDPAATCPKRQKISKKSRNMKSAAFPIAPFVERQKKPEDVGSSTSTVPFDIKSLPNVPVMQILRYLNERSLKMMNKTSRYYNELIAFNRKHLVQSKIFAATIFGVTKNKYELSVTYGSRDEDERVPYSAKGSSSPASCFTWLTKSFSNSLILHLKIHSVCFENESSLEGLEQAFEEAKLQIETIHLLYKSTKCNPHSLLRLLTITNPQRVFIYLYEGMDHFKSLFTDSFLTFVSKLRHFEITNQSHDDSHPEVMFPAHIQKIPKDLIIDDFYIMQKEPIVKAFQEWYENGNDDFLGHWRFSVESCEDVWDLAQLTGLPWERRYRYGSERVVLEITNKRGVYALVYDWNDGTKLHKPTSFAIQGPKTLRANKFWLNPL